MMIASSSNGRTTHSDCVYRGSNPCEAAKIEKPPFMGGFFILIGTLGFEPRRSGSTTNERQAEACRSAEQMSAVERAFANAKVEDNPCEAAKIRNPVFLGGVFLHILYYLTLIQ